MITSPLATLLALGAFLPLAQAMHAIELDVWVPRITAPTKDASWAVGEWHNVTWDASDAPEQITNPKGIIYLVYNNTIMLHNQLATGFNLSDGQVEIRVPNVMNGTYQILLYGDSGDFSPNFTIHA